MTVDRLLWRKSSYSQGTQGDCVELAVLPGALIGVRDSKDPQGGVLELTRADLAALFAGASWRKSS